jgi:4-hydroxybenzoate polyprenyltransferase
LTEYLKIWRVDHWLKNVFIVFGHAVALVLAFDMDPAAGGFTGATLCLWALFSLVPACLVASANYVMNEVLDAPFDALHPTKRHRGIPAGKVKVPVLWVHYLALLAAGFGISLAFFNAGYTLALALLLASGVVYNVPPLRLKDRAYVDVVAESFNNPVRLWLGWFALVPPSGPLTLSLLDVPLSITLAWWFFGALLMTGKRYAEFRFIDDAALSGHYRKSFRVYTEQKLIMAMITYACLFCFGAGVAMASRPQLHNLVFVFPMIVVALYAYFHHAISATGARLEPEQLLQNRWIILSTLATAALTVWLLTSDVDFTTLAGFFNQRGE